MKNNPLNKTLFFSKTNDFLNVYLKNQAMKSDNTVHTYQDGLTIFIRYLSDLKNVHMIFCWNTWRTLKIKAVLPEPVITDLLQSGHIYGMWQMVTYPCSQLL